MLYDKKWDEKKIEAPAHDPLSLDGFDKMVAVPRPWTHGAAPDRALARRNPHAGRAG